MSALVELRLRLDEYQSAELTAGALQDIAALRVSAIRREFDKNRTFYEEIRQLYSVVQREAKRLRVEEAQKKRVRTLLVAVTSNKRFYGSLIRDIVRRLMEEMEKAPDASCLIIGRVGWQYYEQMGGRSGARQMVLKEDVPTREEFQEFITYFENFDRVLMLYPQFINSFKQSVGIEDITQSIEVKETEEIEGYIFEPEVPNILSFFDTQVRRILLDRVMLDAELARTSARLIRMSDSQQRAQHLADGVRHKILRESAAVSNTGLLETFAGFTQWSKR